MWEDDNEGFVACFLIKKGGAVIWVNSNATHPFDLFSDVIFFAIPWLKMAQRQGRVDGDI